MTTLLERVRYLGGDGAPAPTDPAELPELVDGFDRDPEPAAAIRKAPKEPRNLGPVAGGRTARQPRNGGKFVSSTASVKQAADEIEVMLKLLALTWSLTDDECPEILNDLSAKISGDLARLVARSPLLMEHIGTGGLIGDLLKLAITLKPLGQAMWAHHGPAARRARLAEEENGYDAVTVAEPAIQPDRYAPFRPNIATA